MNKIYSIVLATGGVLLVIAAFLVGYVNYKSPVKSGGLYPSVLSSFPNGIQIGGGAYSQGSVFSGINSTSTPLGLSTVTLGSTDVVGYSTISFTSNVPNLVVTLPSSSTLATWLPNPGDFTTFLFLNSTSTANPVANANIGFVAGVGSLLEVSSSSSASTVVVSNATSTVTKGVEINVTRKPNSDLLFSASQYY